MSTKGPGVWDTPASTPLEDIRSFMCREEEGAKRREADRRRLVDRREELRKARRYHGTGATPCPWCGSETPPTMAQLPPMPVPCKTACCDEWRDLYNVMVSLACYGIISEQGVR